MDARLIAFLAVARQGRLSAAARELNISVSALSQQISSLEGEFGVPLFVRTSRGMALTTAGSALLRHAQAIEVSWRQAFRDVRRAALGEASVHLAASQTVAEMFLPPVLGAFRQANPSVRIRLALTNTAGVAQEVETGQVDFGVAEGRVTRPSLVVSRLWQDELGVVVTREHPWARRGVVHVEELLRADLILREEGSGTRSVFERALHEAGYALSPEAIVMESSSLRAILAMVAHSVGVSVLSRSVLSDERQLKLAFVPVAGLVLKRRILLLTRRDDSLSEAARTLIALLRRSAKAQKTPCREEDNSSP